MSPLALRARLSSARRAAIERLAESDVRWRSLGALFVAGGTLGLVSLALPLAPDADVAALATLVGVAVLVGLAMVVWADQLPRADGYVSASLATGTLLISAAIHFNAVTSSPYALLYAWIGLDSFFFLGRRMAFAHVAFTAACYAIVLAGTPSLGDEREVRWLLTTGTILVIGLLADVLRQRSDHLIERLSLAARTDMLTGLLNRRGFEQRIADELERARRLRTSVGLVVGDLDHFKIVNDQFGHQRGDDALREFSAVATGSIRRIDAAARIGGEEFALVLPGTDEHGAYLLAERVRRRTRATLTGYGGRGLSISFGVASFPHHGETVDELVRNADQALYLAKGLGRDRSVTYSPEVAARGPAAGPAVEQAPAVLVLAETLDLRDTGTAAHSRTVGRYAEAIALELGLGPARIERVRLAGLLHDVGKIGVPDPILRKPGPLTDAEWAEMRRHPELGARILAAANLDDISGWVLAHHERPDGRGYPAGLTLEDIPLEARILAVADAFEAMTSDRAYRPGLPAEVAVRQLRRNAGTQFDLEVVEAFLESRGRARAVREAGLEQAG